MSTDNTDSILQVVPSTEVPTSSSETPTRRIAFVDIGISHMNFCVLDFRSKEDHTIVAWEMVDLTVGTSAEKKLCSECGKQAKRVHSDTSAYYCQKKKCVKTIDSSRLTAFKQVRCSHVGLEGIGVNIIRLFDAYPIFDTCQTIYLENQPVYKQPTMKSIQIMLYMYLLVRFQRLPETTPPTRPTISMSNARCKLNVYDGPPVECKATKEYAQRKYLSVQYTKYFLQKYHQTTTWGSFLDSQTKQDDFADSYISALTKACFTATTPKRKPRATKKTKATTGNSSTSASSAKGRVFMGKKKKATATSTVKK